MITSKNNTCSSTTVLRLDSGSLDPFGYFSFLQNNNRWAWFLQSYISTTPAAWIKTKLYKISIFCAKKKSYIFKFFLCKTIHQTCQSLRYLKGKNGSSDIYFLVSFTVTHLNLYIQIKLSPKLSKYLLHFRYYVSCKRDLLG